MLNLAIFIMCKKAWLDMAINYIFLFSCQMVFEINIPH